MAKTFRVKARLEAEDRASPQIDKVQGSFARLSSFISSRLVVTLGDVTRIFRGVVNVFTSVVAASQEQEDAVRKLDAALEGLGPTARATSESLQAQAAALEKVTRFGDEAVISAQAYLASLGVQESQLGTATQATVDLAAALGISLESAARNVGKTVGGFAGELGEVIPELKGLSTEALQAGAGIELLADKFSGRAQADAKTFSGLMDQLGNALGTLQEKAGEAVTKNEELRAGLSGLNQTLQSEGTVAAVEGLAGAFISLSASLAETVNTFGSIGPVFEAQIEASGNVEFELTALAATADRLGISVGELYARIQAGVPLWQQTEQQAKAAAGGINAAGDAAEGSALAVRSLNTALVAAGEAYQSAATGANAFGIVTSTQFLDSLVQMELQLVVQKELLGANSDEFLRFERDARSAMEKVQDRIDSLRNGFGDLNESVGEGTRSISDYGVEANNAATGLERLAAATSRATQSNKELQSGLSGSSFPRTFGGGTFTRIIPNPPTALTGRTEGT